MEGKAYWNGYAQLRGSSDMSNYINFSVRRMKLWLKSTPEFSEHWSYKIQSTISSLHQENFFLQDVKFSYKQKLFSFDFGQFTPAYSLQWSQPDYVIPTIERAIPINVLIPNGTLGIRDIGAQINFHSPNHVIESSLGIFNGTGIVEYRRNDKGYMLTHKTAIHISKPDHQLQFGYSLQYRKANQMEFKHLLPDSTIFSGNDFRYNFFAIYSNKYWSIQGEYLSAMLEKQEAKGYYLQAHFLIKEKSQVVVSYEYYQDLIPDTKDRPYVHLGYNYLINKYKTMVFFDNFFQITEGSISNYAASIQLQIFFK